MFEPLDQVQSLFVVFQGFKRPFQAVMDPLAADIQDLGDLAELPSVVGTERNDRNGDLFGNGGGQDPPGGGACRPADPACRDRELCRAFYYGTKGSIWENW